MYVPAILEELRALLTGRLLENGPEDEEPITTQPGEGLKERRNEIKDKLDNLTSLVAIVGPLARKEAIDLKPFELIYLAWHGPLPEDGNDATDECTVVAVEDDLESMLNLRESVLRALNSLTPGYPEEVEPAIVADMILTVLKPVLPYGDAGGVKIPESMTVEALKVIKNICIRSERNREVLANFIRKEVVPGVEEAEDNSLIAAFCDTISKDPSRLIIRTWCESLSALVLNDDRRVIPNRAEDRKRLITQNGGLTSLMRLLPKFTDPHLLNAIVIAVTMMASSRSQCDALLEAGALGTSAGLELILENFLSEERDRLVLNSILCVRNLIVGSNFQQVLEKSACVRNMVAAAQRMNGRFSHVEVIMSTLGHITIGSRTAVRQFMEADGVLTTLNIMNSSRDDATLLKSCCLILDNVVTHGGEIGRTSLKENDGEGLVKELIKTHPHLIGSFDKVNQRELGLLDL